MHLTKRLGVLGIAAVGAIWLACTGTTEVVQDPVRAGMTADNVDNPLDAAPTSNASIVFYIATSNGQPALFQAANGVAPKVVHAGAPFVEPRNLIVGSKDDVVYVADSKAGPAGDGEIFSVKIGDGSVSAETATQGLSPIALDLTVEGGDDVAYFIGSSKGEPAVFKYDTKSTALTMLSRGAPFVSPGGLVVDRLGAVYVADRDGAGAGKGQVFLVTPQGVSKISKPYIAGDPAGISLTRGGNELALSAMDDSGAHSQILFVDLATSEQMVFEKGISQNTVSGGMHRARNEQIWGWTGKQAVFWFGVFPVDSSTVGGPCDRLKTK